MILLIASVNDVHALAVSRRLVDAGHTPVVLDSAEFPTAWRISFLADGDGPRFVLADEEREIESRDIRGVWNRRIAPFGISDAVADDSVRAFCVDECKELFFGFLHQARNVMNPLAREFAANRKPYQLHCARQAGLLVPRTLISNDPRAIERFYVECDGRVVFKVLSNTEFQFTETRRLELDHLRHLAAASYAPTIFQELIEADSHLRVTVVDDQIFAAELRTSRPEAALDWRLDRKYDLRPIDLPAALNAKILALHDVMGLRYGALDFIVDRRGDAWFLEDNPGGQFLFVEIHTGLPISEAIAGSLSGAHRRAPALPSAGAAV